jgi:hypothetical protein
MNNLADDPNHQKVQSRLKSALIAKLKELDDSNPITTEKGFFSVSVKKSKKN